MRNPFLSCVLLLTAFCVSAQGLDAVHTAEVARLGNTTQHINGGHQTNGTDAVIEAMKPPTSDVDKWFISVISTKGCQPCLELKKAWRSDPWLRALADPNAPKESWAHYCEYMIENKSQNWQFENVKFEAYPTVLVQPPESGKYGDSSIVVFQGAYGGSPKAMAQRIVSTVKRYVRKIAPQVQIVPTRQPAPDAQHGRDVAPLPIVAAPIADQDRNAPCPWTPTPAPETDPKEPWRPFQPNAPPVNQFQIPPLDAAPLLTFPWASLLGLMSGGFSWLAIIAIALWGFTVFRSWRKKSGKEPLLSDSAYKKVTDAINGILDRLDLADNEKDVEVETISPEPLVRKRAAKKKSTRTRR